MDAAKIRLSAQEQELVGNPGWILTKNQILAKVKLMLEGLLPPLQERVQSYREKLPAALLQPGFKISRGENYRGLPYLVLDYPRHFSGEDIFAVRTLFWWGHYFSFNIQLSGIYQQAFSSRICAAFPYWKENGFYIATTEDAWQHQVEESNYLNTAQLSPGAFEREVRRKKYIKLTALIPLTQWDEVPGRVLQFTAEVLEILTEADQFPRR